jgi:hypothetical protein
MTVQSYRVQSYKNSWSQIEMRYLYNHFAIPIWHAIKIKTARLLYIRMFRNDTICRNHAVQKRISNFQETMVTTNRAGTLSEKDCEYYFETF